MLDSTGAKKAESPTERWIEINYGSSIQPWPSWIDVQLTSTFHGRSYRKSEKRMYELAFLPSLAITLSRQPMLVRMYKEILNTQKIQKAHTI